MDPSALGPDTELLSDVREPDWVLHKLRDRATLRLAFTTAMSVLHHRQDAEDVVQLAWMTAFTRQKHLRNRESFFGWFVVVVRNQARNALRSRQLRELVDEDVDAVGSRQPPLNDIIPLLQAVLALSPSHRQAILLHEVHGFSYAEIGAAIGLPEGTVRVRFHRAMCELRKQLVEDTTDSMEQAADPGASTELTAPCRDAVDTMLAGLRGVECRRARQLANGMFTSRRSP